jgi:ABC-type glycerol-3-phosphate transport system permease component
MSAVAEGMGLRRRQRTQRKPNALGGFGRGLAVISLLCVAASTIYPLLFVLATALKSPVEYRENKLGVPDDLTWDNIRYAWDQAQIGAFAMHSAIAVGCSIVLIVLLASGAGYAFAHMRFPFQRASFVGVLTMMMLPTSVLMVPIFGTVQDLGLLNKYEGLVLVYTSLNLPFSIYLMASYFRGIPGELFQAARIDGASPIRAFLTIALPLVRPGLLTLATLNFLWLWNELLFSLLLLQDPSKRTLMTGLALLNGEHTTSVPLISAGLLLSLIPPLAVFALFQRNLAEGLTAGAIK